MPITIVIDDDTPILVELKQGRGEREVSVSPRDILEKSTEALNNTLATVYGMARRVVTTIKHVPLSERPDEIAVEFGIMMKSDANAFIVNAGMEAQIKVTLRWQRQAAEAAQNDVE